MNSHSSAATADSPLHPAFSNLSDPIRRAISKAGYTTPTPIQAEAIPLVASGRDLIGCAQTGTGKTAAFTLPLLERLLAAPGRPKRSHPRALILAPTRELAAQIGESIKTYSVNLQISHAVIFGGVKQGPQVRQLTHGVDILVATPGRLLDLMEQGHINLDSVRHFILDEVDRMLDMGFIRDIKKVLTKLPQERQTLFFSATMPREMRELAATMVRDPATVTIDPETPAVERIRQSIAFLAKADKDLLLIERLRDSQHGKTIVFTQMKHVANRVVTKLAKAGIESAAIHGNKSQGARTKALNAFRQGEIKVLIATDVAARGIDIDGITQVINYDLPMEAETYVHRIGRTARAGRDGEAISFCCETERLLWTEIERLLGKTISQADHAYHSEAAQTSTLKPIKGGGGRNQQRQDPSGASKGSSSKRRRGPSRRKANGEIAKPGQKRRRSRRRSQQGNRSPRNRKETRCETT
ncbi:MAG: DEAD/DEAH box helicase [Verrucomicrobiota bacterium]